MTAPRLTVKSIRAVPVMAPMTHVLGTSAGVVRTAPLLLFDLQTQEGITGRAYQFCYTPAAAPALVVLLNDMLEAIRGETLAPAALRARLSSRYKLIGVQGIVRMGMSLVDVAAWDALSQAAGMPLAAFLGAVPRAVPAYNSNGLGLMALPALADEAETLLAGGFRAVKLRLGYPTLREDLAAVRAVRGRIGENVALMVDYNQALSVPEALARGRALDGEGVYWIEEPVRHDDYRGCAQLKQALSTPVQIGENLSLVHDMQKALEADACDYVMPDLERIGGVSGWLEAGALAHASGLPMSSHLYPETSAHLLAATPGAHWLEYVDWMQPLLQEPLRIDNGMAQPSDRPGIGLMWNEDVVRKLAVRYAHPTDMQLTSDRFKETARIKLHDPRLQAALDKLQTNFVQGRAQRVKELDNFEAIRDAGAAIRDRALAHLDVYLDEFERNATARGAVVHWAETVEDVNRIVCDLAKQYGVRKVVKSKSMVTEECALNDALEAAGVEVVETDLGEYILQLAKEPPSHIVAPVVHKTRDEVSDLFEAKHRRPRTSVIAELTREARETLRPHFLTADMGITGANFVVAETGSTLIVTNEGNGRMVTTLPRVHVAITGIEKVVPTLEDVTTLLRLLPRHATGQTISNYISITTGPKRAGDLDGPEHAHVILVDAGRSKLLGGDMQEMLRCIRCGACMNHCPVYQSIGGHAYGWVYPGPMGSVLTPTYVGLEKALDLPHASTLCNQCGVACPVKIPLPDLLRKLRERQFERGLRPWRERAGLALWAWTAKRPRIYGLLAATGAKILSWLGGGERTIHSLPGARGWTGGRDLPAPEGKTFRELYVKRRAGVTRRKEHA